MLQELLKQATAGEHTALEQQMFVNQIMHGSLTADQYKKLLLTNYISHAIFEEELFSKLSPGLQQELDLPNRAKLESLKKDLEEMQLDPPDISRFNFPAIADGDAAVIGALYVLEGATLGGNVIVKRLKVNPQLEPLNLNYHYYQVYGPALIDRWKQFVQTINTRIPEADYEQAVVAAKAMFKNIERIGAAQ